MTQRTTSELRKIFASLVGKGYNKSFIARLFDTTRQTIARWSNRIRSVKDKPRKPKDTKITLEVELFILAIRTTFSWGTARIQQALWCLPSFMKEALVSLSVTLVQGITLSRQAINMVLKKHGLNGYLSTSKGWKFFRASCPNELWQLDIKGPFTIQGTKYYFVVCIDDYSRYLVLMESLDHAPTIKEISGYLELRLVPYAPKAILTDNNPFKKEWDVWCNEHQIEPLHAHPYYPQDKGKVERAIRNVSEEFIYLLKRFPEWLDGKIREFQDWFNHDRYHRGIRGHPADLYLPV